MGRKPRPRILEKALFNSKLNSLMTKVTKAGLGLETGITAEVMLDGSFS